MSKHRKDADYIRDIQDAIIRIADYIKGFTYDDFLADGKTKDAVVHNIEIVGEATKNLGNRIRNKYQQVPWKSMAGMRDRLTHGYFDVNYEIVWNIVKNELTILYNQIIEILAKEKLDSRLRRNDKGSRLIYA